MTMTMTEVLALIGSAGVIAAALLKVARDLAPHLLALRKELAANTTETTAAKRAATGAQDAAQRALTSAEAIQLYTVDRADYDRLRRMEAALQTLEGCDGCRTEILNLIDRRRLRPHAPPTRERAS